MRRRAPVTARFFLFGLKHSYCLKLFPRHVLEQLGDDVVGGFAFGVRLEGADEPMAEDQGSEGRDIFTGDVEPALAGGAGSAAKRSCQLWLCESPPVAMYGSIPRLSNASMLV